MRSKAESYSWQTMKFHIPSISIFEPRRVCRDSVSLLSVLRSWFWWMKKRVSTAEINAPSTSKSINDFRKWIPLETNWIPIIRSAVVEWESIEIRCEWSNLSNSHTISVNGVRNDVHKSASFVRPAINVNHRKREKCTCVLCVWRLNGRTKFRQIRIDG